jgi:hypothetical protein
MLRRNHILTTAALLAVGATPASAATYEDLRSDGGVAPPPSSIAASAADEYQDLRSPDAKDAAREAEAGASEQGPYVLNRGYGSPDAVDAARDLPPAQVPAQTLPGPYTDSQRALVESPEVQQTLDRIRSEIRPVVEISSSSGGFDWGDAGIGAAGMLALFSIAAGSGLLLVGRKRRHGIEVAH